MNPDSDNSGQNPRSSANAWMLLVTVIAFSVEPLLRWGFGRRYFGRRVLLVIPWMMLVTTFWSGEDASWLLLFFGSWFVVCGWNRLSGLVRRSRGLEEPVHSYYDGTPRLLSIFARIPGLRHVSERSIKRLVEPALLFLVALALRPIDLPLGGYLLLASVALLAKSMAIKIASARQLQDYRDAMIEQRVLRTRYLQTYGND